MRITQCLALIFSAILPLACAHAEVPAWRQEYLQRYALPDIYTKLVDDHGDGYAGLYGARNVREVIPGLVYRGGANNVYDKNGRRSNSNPLPVEGLQNFCKQGFANGVYLYSTNYKTSPHAEDCAADHAGAGHFDYTQQSVLLYTSAQQAVLKMAYDTITGKTSGPMYLHCWNGWHASGYISALILRQFCGFTGDQAVNYWDKNTDGNDVGSSEYNQIRQKIRAYVPDATMPLDAATQQAVCPAP